MGFSQTHRRGLQRLPPSQSVPHAATSLSLLGSRTDSRREMHWHEGAGTIHQQYRPAPSSFTIERGLSYELLHQVSRPEQAGARGGEMGSIWGRHEQLQ